MGFFFGRLSCVIFRLFRYNVARATNSYSQFKKIRNAIREANKNLLKARKPVDLKKALTYSN